MDNQCSCIQFDLKKGLSVTKLRLEVGNHSSSKGWEQTSTSGWTQAGHSHLQFSPLASV